MDIDYNSANMAVDIDGSAPDTDISPDKQWAVLHLSRNANPIIAGDRTASDADISAINISGTVDVYHSPAGDISKLWEFRFIQLARLSVVYALYAGRTPKDGFISINFAAPPAFPQKFAYDFVLDSAPEIFGPNVMPFTNLRAPVLFPKRNNKGNLVPGVSTVVTDMDDHPSLRLRLAFQNKETTKDNFLAQVIREESFLTAFVVRDKQKKIKILAYVCWYATWKARYHWAGGDCIPHPVVGTFDVGKSIKGPPTGPTMGKTGSSLEAKITSPTTDPKETANTLARTATQNLGAHPLFWNRSFGKQWPADVPSDFWTR